MLSRWWTLLWLLSATGLYADEVGLIRLGETWRYFPGRMAPSDPAERWREMDFNDLSWPSGRSGFSFGLATYIEATYVANPTNFVSAFFRKKFIVSDPQAVKWLLLRADYEEGMIAYLNGTEVFRRNLDGAAGSTIPFHVPANGTRARGAPEEIDLTSAIPLLKTGENLLAIQVHSAGPSSSFSLLPELLANFTRGPILQGMSSNRVQIIWRTLLPTDGIVEYGTTPELGFKIEMPEQTTNHVATLADLNPATTYFYRVSSGAGDVRAMTAIESFRTLPAEGPLTFMVLGDSGSGSLFQYMIADVMRNANPDLVLHAGDIIYPSFTTPMADLRCLSVYGAHMRKAPYFFTIGNHDLYSGDQHYLEAFYLPTNAVPVGEHQLARTSPEHYYSFDAGDVHFAVLFVPMLSQYTPQVGDTQYNWLAQDLAESKKPWKFLLFHHPMATSASHSRDDFNFNGIKDMHELAQVFIPLAAQHGVQMVFSGHDHTFERFMPIQGVTQIVTGGGGNGVYFLINRHPASGQFLARFNTAKVQVFQDHLIVQAMDHYGQPLDWMNLYRVVPTDGIWPASWHTPVVESRPADDTDGNINGQRLDFIGTPIPALAGKFSNLSRAYVNHDRSTLFIGFEQVMLASDQNLFLFIEAPGLPGVSRMKNLGNGAVDPDGQGADGLDFLENLSFNHFSPGIACILGDEMADATARSFLRPELLLDVGQGVFRLDESFSDVAGAQIQQFNRSPQVFDPTYNQSVRVEQNADCIEVAIPLVQLGELKPGDVIKIAAVIGMSSYDTNADRQMRQLDTGYLGRRITFNGDEVLLEPVTVQLAPDPDPDLDGLLSIEEINLGTDPLRADTDGDGMPDGWEVQYALNPLSTAGRDGPEFDIDNDGLTNLQESAAGTNPSLADTDGDGLLDRWEVAMQLNPRSGAGADGAHGDPDGDRLLNAHEQIAGTHPRNAQSGLKLEMVPLTNDRYRLSWGTVVGKKYELQFTTDPKSPFQTISGGVFPAIASEERMTFDDDFSGSPAPFARYYRVRLIP